MDVKLNQLEQSVDVNRQNYRLYLAKFEESRISDAMDNKKMANVSLMQSAFIPLKPVSPKVLLNIVLAIFLGGFGGLGLAFFTEYLDDSLGKPEHVEKVLQLPVLASIPKLEIPDTQAPLKSPPAERGAPGVWTELIRPQVTVAMMVVLIGGLIYTGFHYLESTEFLAVRSANSNSEIKGHESKSVPSNHEKQLAAVTLSDVSKQPVVDPRTDTPDLPKGNVEPKISAEDNKGSDITGTVSSNHKKQLAAVTFSDVSRQPVVDPRTDTPNLSKENVEPKPGAKDNKSPDITVPVTKDEKMNQVVYKNGQNLYRIIIKTYGTYNDEILNKVLRANPDIISPTQLHDGQIINLPVITKQSRDNRTKDNKRPDITVPVTEDKKMSQVVVKKGQNLFRIIIQNYGTYNDEILNKVLRANPNITGPAQINAGQTINLPVNRGQMSGIRDQG